MKSRKRLLSLILAVILLPLALLVWQMDRQYHQEQLNHALISAIKKQDRRRVLELLTQGADANTHDTDEVPTIGQILRRWIAQIGRRQGGKPETAEHPAALILASESFNLSLDVESTPAYEEIMLALLDHGANANSHLPQGSVPIYNAIHLQQDRILRSLLDHGADPNIVGISDIRPLQVTMTLHHYEEAALLVAHGADVNAVDSNGATSLMRAAQYDEYEAIRWLLQHGANPNIQDQHGQTALSFVTTRKYYYYSNKIVALLRQYGAK